MSRQNKTSSSSTSSSRKSRRSKRATRSGNGGLAASGAVSEQRSVFNSVGKPISFRLPVPSPNREYRHVTTFYISAALTSSVASEQDLGQNFTLSAMNATELAGFQSIFDQYRIIAIETLMVPRTSVGSGINTQNPGLLVSAVDYDSSASTSINNLLTYTNALTSTGFDSHYHAFTPTVDLGAGAGGSSSSNNVVTVRSPWLDLGITNTPHYGLKYAVNTTDVPYTFDQHVRFHLSFRHKI